MSESSFVESIGGLVAEGKIAGELHYTVTLDNKHHGPMTDTEFFWFARGLRAVMPKPFVWYFAAQFNRLTEIANYAERARAAGLMVNSRWLTQDAGLGYSGGSEGAGAMFAARDLEDIKTADGLLFFAEDPSIGVPRGGRHVEFGVALALGKKIEVCGPKENVFHLLPNVVHYKTFEEWLQSKIKEAV